MVTITAKVTDSSGATATATATATQTVAWAWPTAATTGAKGALIPATSNTISKAGTYSGLSFKGVVQIAASNVILDNCLITAAPADPWSLGVPGGLTGAVFKNSTIIGAGAKTTQSAAAYGFYCQGNSQVTIDSCDISQVGQNAINDGQVTITNNYIHDLHSGPGSHYECIYYGGASKNPATFSLVIRGNNMSNLNPQTAVVYIENYFGPVNNVTIDSNLLVGGDYVIYVEGNQAPNNIGPNVVVTNNALGLNPGEFGYLHLDKGKAPAYQVTSSGNYDYLTKAPVTAN